MGIGGSFVGVQENVFVWDISTGRGAQPIGKCLGVPVSVFEVRDEWVLVIGDADDDGAGD